MGQPFRNALCLAGIPDWGWNIGGYWLSCKRRTNHLGRHRVVFRDGGVREWDSGDTESELTKKPSKEDDDGTDIDEKTG